MLLYMLIHRCLYQSLNVDHYFLTWVICTTRSVILDSSLLVFLPQIWSYTPAVRAL